MAWLSISLLLLSISFITYHHGPATWRQIPQWLRSAKPYADTDNDAHNQKTVTGKIEENEITEEKKHDVPVMIPAEEEGDATPKAEAANTETIVPSFNLDNSHVADVDQQEKEEQERIEKKAQEEEDEVEEEEQDERDNLPPPMFPAANSSQRASPSLMAPPPPLKPSQPTSAGSVMAPPPPPRQSSLMPPPGGPPRASSTTASSSLRIPSTGPLPNRGPPTSSSLSSPAAQARASSNSLAPSRIDAPNSRNKVQLTPGHSPLDWATLARSKNLSNVSRFLRVTPSMLKHYNGRKDRETGLKKDAWSVYQGKVYNISPYLPFHPGGEGELLRAAGKDGTALFNDVHPWVNWEGMLSSCLVGILVSETDESSGLDSLD